jgi:NADH-quinone oxidoreductase subunit C/D
MADGTPIAPPEVVRELYARFGENAFVHQSMKDDVPTLWAPLEQRDAVLRFLKKSVPRPFRMLLDLQAVDERMRRHREALPQADFTLFYHLLSIERCGPQDSGQIRIKIALKGEHPAVKSIVGPQGLPGARHGIRPLSTHRGARG